MRASRSSAPEASCRSIAVQRAERLSLLRPARLSSSAVPRLLASPSRAALSLALGALLALPPAWASATLAPNTRQQSERLLAEGDAAASAKRWDEAISKYRASYYGFSADDQASYLGSLPVRKAMQAYAERVTQEQDPAKRRALLQRQRVLLEEFLDAVAAKPGATDEVGDDVIAELEQTRRSIDAELDPKVAEPSPTEPTDPSTRIEPADPGPDPVDPGPATADDTKPRRDWLGVGLTIGGSTLIAAGLGVTVGWWTVRNTAQENVDSGGAEFAEGTDARETYLATEEARAKKFLIAGSVVAGVGLATAIGGVVHIVLHRRRDASRATALRLSPILSPTTAGLVLQRRF